MSVNDDLGFHHVFEPGTSPESPTLLLLHGTGGDEQDMIPLGRELLPDAAILSPLGRENENGMARFFRRIAPGVFDLENLGMRTHELHQFMHDASKKYTIDLSHLIAIGYSNGANILASLLLLHPETVKIAILLHPILPFTPEVLPNLRGTRVLITAGQNDPMVPPAGTHALAGLLQQSGADVAVQWGAGGHEIREEEIRKVKEWLHQ